MKKAQIGLPILLSVMVAIFLTGLLLMIYALMSAGLIDSDSLYTSLTGSEDNETLTSVEDVSGESLSVAGYRSVSCSISAVTNASNGKPITSANYTLSDCNLKSSGDNAFNNTNWNVTYSYSFLNPTEAVNVINDTSVSLGGTTAWFPIMIVMVAMVVLILLTVIIITAIRGSGLMGNGKGGQGGDSGTA